MKQHLFYCVQISVSGKACCPPCIDADTYSCLRASMGFKFAAFTDGMIPKMIPMRVEKTTAMMMAGTLMATGAWDRLEIT